MMDADLDAALRAVEASGRSRNRITRHHARPVLLSIGERLLDGRTEEAEEALARVSRLPGALREPFQAAVLDELAMACTEFVRSVDPRYLDRPDYDLDYTVTARHRLEARLRAAQRLGVLPDAPTLDQVRRTDQLLGSRTDARRTKS